MDLKLDVRVWAGLMWLRIGDKWQAVLNTVRNFFTFPKKKCRGVS